ncbi:DMT family transporter [Paenibacillus allorhizosphaerae]|uniref:Amino-acid metabolite efflux pump n=1 Tax=Paenibacillus allorhizosphaerae TaxID=2849866 RepID=A0ABM8VJE2_9BACL|nr:DMT family transporter [Paenibacillus allorhizosphaerae]CAG7645364.1 putative amino-acid metabolite efflux pump [Paenibacillus allorhizosphaerae]
MQGLSRTRTTLLVAFLVLVWGVNWPLSKFALSYTPPVLFSGMRTLLGGLLLLFAAVPRYKQLRLKETWHIYILSSLLNIICYYGLQTIGLNYLPAGLFATIVFLQPVLLGVFSWLWLGEAMYGLKIVGLILGFSGVAVISAGGLSGHISAVGILLALGSALSWALGTSYVKKVSGAVDPIWLVTLQLIFGGLVMTGVGSEVESWSGIIWNVPYISSLLFISVFVIAIGWLVFYKLIGSGEATKVASYTFLIPLVAILIGTVFLHEPFTLYLLAGLILIVVSIFLVNRKPGKSAARL